jgi:hypothetical protein
MVNARFIARDFVRDPWLCGFNAVHASRRSTRVEQIAVRRLADGGGLYGGARQGAA